jgi:C4-dicarboxylate transporter, DctM subunit
MMTPGWTLLILFFALLVLDIPIAISLGLSSISVILFFDLMPLSGVSSVFFGTLEKFPLLAIPFFIYSGFVMERGDISHKLIRFVNGVIGKVTGGLAHVVIVVGVLLAGISGSGPADTAALGSVLVPSMTKLKYDKAFCCGLISVVGSLGIVVPPSIAFIVYGIVSNTSIVKLFIAGIVPGVMCGIALALPVYFISKKRGYSGEERASLRENVTRFKDAIWGLLAPVFILGGLYSGIFTATELSAVLAIYVTLVTAFIYRNIKPAQFLKILSESAILSGMVLLIIGSASLFSWILTTQGIAARMGESILAFSTSPTMFLAIISVVLLIAGCFLETNAIIFMFTPIFLPIAAKLGIDPIFMGALMIVNLAIGQSTPPLGVNLFVCSGLSGLKIETIAYAAMPFILACISVMILMILFPDLIMWFPRLLY